MLTLKQVYILFHLKIRFIGVRGKGFCGDIAIDDIHFVNGSCNTGKYPNHFWYMNVYYMKTYLNSFP